MLQPQLGCIQAGDSGARARAAETRRRRRIRGGGSQLGQKFGGGLAAGWPYPLLSQICMRMIRHPSKQASCTAGSFAESVGEASPCRTVARGVREDGCVARTHCCAVVLRFGVVASQA